MSDPIRYSLGFSYVEESVINVYQLYPPNHSPQTPEELFNYRHAYARNVIERDFGIKKARFKILDTVCYFPLSVQGVLLPALCVLHNFLRINDDNAAEEHEVEDILVWSDGLGDRASYRTSDYVGYGPDENVTADLGGVVTVEEAEEANERRDRIAAAMWADYSDHMSQRYGPDWLGREITTDVSEDMM